MDMLLIWADWEEDNQKYFLSSFLRYLHANNKYPLWTGVTTLSRQDKEGWLFIPTVHNIGHYYLDVTYFTVDFDEVCRKAIWPSFDDESGVDLVVGLSRFFRQTDDV